MTYSILAEELVKQFGTTRALDGIDLEVPTGTQAVSLSRWERKDGRG
jgi:hypothetical protein